MNFFADEKNNRKIFWALLAVIFLVLLLITPDYGISGDDATQWRYGTSVWNYLKTFGADKTAVTGKYLENTQTLYGGIVDGVAAMLIDIFKPENEFIVRHYWIMLFGFMGIIYTGLLARKITGSWLGGILSVLFIVFTPRFFGEICNNPKDIPFAATYVMALYYIILWVENLAAPKWKYTVLLGIAIMLCLGIRIGGLLLLAYLFLAYVITMWQSKTYKNSAAVKTTVVHGVVLLLIGYFGACLWWPYAWEDPISHPYEAFKVMSDYPAIIKMLFEGQIVYSSFLPAYYTPKFIAITLPLFALVGIAGTIVMLTNKEFRARYRFLWLIIFSWAFPVFYIVYKHSVVYDGMRHTLFVLPAIAITTAVFFYYLLQKFREKRPVSLAIAGVLAILVALPARYSFANHPNQYIYFNELIGGVKGAYGIYETDYYMNSIKEGFDWLNENELAKLNTKDSVVLATNCVEPIFQYMLRSKVPLKIKYVRYYQKNADDWDYGIFYGRFLDREELQKGFFPAKNAIHNVTADGVTLTTILKNDPERLGYKGYDAMLMKDSLNAVYYLNAAIKKDPYDIELWGHLANTYYTMNKMKEAKEAIDKAREISTIDIITADLAGQIALKSGDINSALQLYSEITENYPQQGEGYLGLARAQAAQGNFSLALDNISTALDYSPYLQQQAYRLAGMIYQATGDMEKAQKFLNMAEGR